MANKTISLIKDFTDAPGGRFREDGDFSGEQFRNDDLLPALEAGTVLVDLNGALGLPASFLDESFGVIGRKYTKLVGRLTVVLDDNEVAQKHLSEMIPHATLSWQKPPTSPGKI